MRISLSALGSLSLTFMSLSGSLLGCAGGEAAGHRVYQGGDPTGQPRVEALPSIDVDPSALTQEMRMARMLSAESLNLSPPVHPRETSSATIADWSDNELKAWMKAKNDSAEAARKELDLAAVQNHRQRIMAGAMVGLVYEDVARTLLTLPIPAELVSEPDIAKMYVEILHTQAGPYLMQSRTAYAACAGNAAQTETLRHWSEFCTSREENLPGVGPAETPTASTTTGTTPGQGREGKTTVSVYQ